LAIGSVTAASISTRVVGQGTELAHAVAFQRCEHRGGHCGGHLALDEDVVVLHRNERIRSAARGGRATKRGADNEAAADPLPQVLRMSHCPYCNIEHPWRTEDARIIAVTPTDRASISGEAARLDEILGLLVEAAIERSAGKSPRAAIYLANDKG